LNPLTQPNIFFNIYFENYLIFQRFWYKKFENRVKTQLTVFFWLNYIHVPEIIKKYTELSFYSILKILAPKSFKIKVVFKKKT